MMNGDGHSGSTRGKFPFLVVLQKTSTLTASKDPGRHGSSREAYVSLQTYNLKLRRPD